MLQRIFSSNSVRASQLVKNLPANAGEIRDMVRSLGQEDPLEESMDSCLENPTEEPGGLWYTGSQRVRHDRESEHK